MKDKDFKEFLKSIDQAKEIIDGKRKPSRVFKYTPMRVKKIRLQLKQSQNAFSHMLGISVATLRNWEQGRRVPEGPAQALLKVAAVNPKAVLEALHF